ncbi:hypothetical protein SAY87_031228 [Trapa incisa]|uniref:RING-type E3 ubiquitin transferase n=1 Tax=Trapa incisa TaxID=236973 RepID=A0AAN7KNY6_9MYRT|nr:hypothetical protein SAY87_031228 [Trapa incisa]
MGVPAADDRTPSSSSPHPYPQALQLKLYQAFIFSIPILFSIILFLLFYLFYLKRRTSSTTSLSPPPDIARVSRRAAAPYLPSRCEMGLKGELKNKLPIVVFDEELGRKDSQCCVCLGEFQMEEQLLQMPSCKHVFHVDCIHHWLHASSTCPLCRCTVTPTATPAVSSSIHPPLQQAGAAPPLPTTPETSSSSGERMLHDPNDCWMEHYVALHVR